MKALHLTALATLLALSALSAPSAQAASTAPASQGVAWHEAAGDADIESAFAKARAEKKPVLLYWGAKWCPPCNQLKATLFNRQDFIEQSKSFVAVHIDGDLPGAQKLGSRFKVRGYPTMILFSNDGNELTRLPGEAEVAQVMRVLQLGLAGGRPIKTVLADGRAGKKLSANEWKLLAFYSWETDEQSLVPKAETPALLAALARAAQGVDEDSSTRLWLKALATSDDGKGIAPDAALRARVQAVLAKPAAARQQMDVLAYYGTDIVSVLAPKPGPERDGLIADFSLALKRLEADATLSRSDRLAALTARIELARLNQSKDEVHPKLAAALQAEAREYAATADREISDGYERQAVITEAAFTLGRAGLWKDSDALLKSSLAKSHSPYYLMSQLAGNARKQGRKDEALKWYEEAFNKSEGPATRLQWGSKFFTALIDLAPQDSGRIEKTAAQLLKEAAQDKSAFYERSARSLKEVGTKLASWNQSGAHNDAVARLRAQLDGVCAKVDAGQKATCDTVIKAPSKG